jgi:hypothetical protein
MEPDDTRTQAEIDADIAQLRAELISVINPRQAYWLRGIAFTLNTQPSAVFNGLLNDVQPLLELADAALAFTAHPDPNTVSALTAAADAMRASWTENGQPRIAGIAAVEALGKLHDA